MDPYGEICPQVYERTKLHIKFQNADINALLYQRNLLRKVCVFMRIKKINPDTIKLYETSQVKGHECYPQNAKYVAKLSDEWCWMTGVELTEMIKDEDFQWIWGVFSAFPKEITKEKVMNYKLPKADGNERIWQNPISLQHPFSVIEIIAWDSSMTIVITEFDDIIEKLEKSNPIVKDLEDYNKY